MGGGWGGGRRGWLRWQRKGKVVDPSPSSLFQVIPPDDASTSRLLAARARMQGTYLAQFDELYEDFHIVRVPLLDDEVRGTDAIRAFSRLLVDADAAAAAGARGRLAGGGGEGGLEADNAALRARVAQLEAALAAARAT